MRRQFATLLALLSVALSATLAPIASSANEPGWSPFRRDQAGSFLPPPGYGAIDQPVTVMLELDDAIPADGASPGIASAGSPDTVQRQLAALGIPVLFRTRLAYNGIAVTATPRQFDTLRRLAGVAGLHVIPPKERSVSRTATFIGTTHFWSASGGLTGEGVRIGIIDSGIDYTHATFGGAGTPQAFLANDPAIVEPGTFPTSKVVAGYDFVGDGYDASGRYGTPIAAPDADPLDCAGPGTDAIRRVSGGHGTHVAGIAAGFGVDAAGTTYDGPYSGSISYERFIVGPGVAPEASLVALKIFGCRGTSTYLTRAIDYALDPNGDGDSNDRLVDVLNISLGSPFGGDDDPDAAAISRAVAEGVVVVVAAGDTGNTFYAIDSPASARQAIAVGASVDAGRDPLLVPDTLDLLTSRGPQRNGSIKPDLVAPGVGLLSAAAGSGAGALSLTGTSVATPQVAGAAALLRQLRPSWSPAQIKSALMNATMPARDANGVPYPPSLAGAGRLDLSKLAAYDLLAFDAADPAAVGLSYGAAWVSGPQQLQRMLRITNTGDNPRTVRLAPVVAAEENGVLIETPPGPYRLRPGETLDVPVTISVQPAALDFTRDAATPERQGPVDPPAFDRYYLAEHSGVVEVVSTLGARLRAAHAGDLGYVAVYVDDELLESSIAPGDVGEYRAFQPGRRLVRVTSAEAPPSAQPLVAREFDVVDGRDYTLVVYGSCGNSQLALVDETADEPFPRDRALFHVFNGDLLCNGSAVDVYVDGVLFAAGLPVGATSAFGTLSPGRHTVRFVRAGASPTADDTLFPGESPDGGRTIVMKEFIASAGEVILASGRGCSGCKHRIFIGYTRPENTLTTRVPFQIIPRSAAAGAATLQEQTVAPDATMFSINLRNSGARNQLTSPRGSQTPLVSAFELSPGGRSPRIASLPDSLRSADIQYVGVTSSYPALGWRADLSGAAIFFGLAGHAAWSTPNEVQYRVYISTTGPGGAGLPDDVPEYMLVHVSLGAITPLSGTDGATRPDDVFRAQLYRIQPDGTLTADRFADWNFIPPPSVTPFLDSAPFNTSVMVLVTTAGFLGLSPSLPLFNYYVETYARDAGGFTERIDRVPATGTIAYDLRFPAVAPLNTSATTGVVRQIFPTPFVFGVDGAQITGMVNQTELAVRRSQEVLLLHHHNAPGTQAEVVTLQSARPALAPLARPYRFYMPIVASE